MTLKIGGAFDREHSEPVKVRGNVKLISDGRWVARARGYNTGITTCMGRSVVLEVGQVMILMAERSAMTVDPELFRSHGIDPVYCKIVVVKSPNGFDLPIEPIARALMVVDTPGVSLGEFTDPSFQSENTASHLSARPRHSQTRGSLIHANPPFDRPACAADQHDLLYGSCLHRDCGSGNAERVWVIASADGPGLQYL